MTTNKGWEMHPEGQPQYCNETNYNWYQADLCTAIKLAAQYPPSHPGKAQRLEFLHNMIANCGADPMEVMELQGEDVTCMQRAIEMGCPLTLRTIRDAMAEFAKKPPMVITKDIDAFRSEDIKKKLPVAILFPGQGSQYVKMLTEVKDLAPCRALIDKATEILGWDVLDLCLNGPEERLEDTKYCQPALFVANCCALERLRLEKPDLVERAQASAGLSLGEYNALWFSKVMSFEDCIRIVRVRADAMAEESKKSQQRMMSVAGLDLETLQQLCQETSRKAGMAPEGHPEIVQIANHLFPKGYAVSGSKKACEMLKEAADKAGALQCRMLKTSGAFHTSLMAPAGNKLEKSLKAYVTNQSFPQVDLYMNISGFYQRAGTDPRELNMDLVAQISNPVLWQKGIEQMIKDGITEFYECGPMKQLKAMMKRINQQAWEKTTSVEV